MTDETMASESSDIAAWWDMCEAAPADFRGEHNLRAVLSDGALTLTSVGLRLAHFNSMIGLGVAVPATEAQVDEAMVRFRQTPAAGYMIHVVAGARPPELEEWLRARGLRPAGAWERVARGGQALSSALPDHSRVEEVLRYNAAEWAGFIDRVYGLHTAPWLVELVGRPGWQHYTLREGGVVVAARSMFVDVRQRAWLGIDAPVPGLMTNRFDRDFSICTRMILDGLGQGVRSFFTDIEAPREDHEGPAYTGFGLLGFRPVYLRRHFVPAAA